VAGDVKPGRKGGTAANLVAYLAAISLAGVAAYFRFPEAPSPIIPPGCGHG